MNPHDIALFEWKVKHILDWSAIDPGTKVVLQTLMNEVSSLAKISLH